MQFHGQHCRGASGAPLLGKHRWKEDFPDGPLEILRSERIDLSLTKTLELWDFGIEDIPGDWTRLPSFPADRKSTVTR